jgi:predicted metal-dependent hydrolase
LRPDLPPNLHPDLEPAERRRLFRLGIELFNRGAFFEAHETWEEIWRSTTPEPRTLFQGIIQVAAAMHQIRDLRRRTGPRNTLAKARKHLEPYAPLARGLDVADLLAAVRRWQDWLEEPQMGMGIGMPEWPAVRVVDWAAVE